jgi:hypothetical protein
MSEIIPYNNNIHNDYGIFIDIDDNNYFIRKYSDENIPIYNKTLGKSSNCIISEKYENVSSTNYDNYIHLICYKLKRNKFLCLRIMMTSLILYIAYTIYSGTFYSVSLM